MKMILVIAFSLFITTLQAQNEFVVKVNMKNPGNHKMLLAYSKAGNYFIDTSYVRDGNLAVFKGSVPSMQVISFIVRDPAANIQIKEGFIPSPSLKVLVHNGALITVEGDAERPWMASIQSSDAQVAEFEIFRTKDKFLEDRSWQLTKKVYANPDKETIDKETETEQQMIAAQRLAWQKEFVKSHPDSYAALEVLSYYAFELDDEELEKQFAALSPAYKTTELGANLADKIKSSGNTRVGKKAIPFTLPGSNGSPVDIAAMKGRYVLLDFWGSWCGPCRASHPHLKELYARYKDRGLEIVGIASENGTPERQLEVWKEAIKSDGMNWLQVLNDPEKIDIVSTYGVAAFPTKILLDKEGTIIMKSIGGEGKELDEKLQALLGK